MIVLPSRKSDEVPELPPMPPYASATSVLPRALPTLSPANRMTVVDAAEEYMRVNANGRWAGFDRNVTPYMIEPANMMASRRYREIIFVGPARTGKTVMLLQGVSHLVMCDPGPCQIVHMTEQSAADWVDSELRPMIENSEGIAERQGLGRSDRNILSKKFVGGAKVTLGPPTKTYLSSKTTKLVMFTDLDRMPLNIGKEGHPFTMGAKRTETLGSRGMTVGESSPGHLIKDADWTPSSVHEAPPCDGILDLYNGGTRACWYWVCPDCKGEFEPRADRLEYDATLTPTAAGKAAVMVCPHCGAWIEHRHKVELNRGGYWLHETEGGGLVQIDSPDVRPSERLSYQLDGAAAAFASWARIIAKYETARRAVENGGAEEALQVVVNTDFGRAHLPIALKNEGGLTLADLRAMCRKMGKGIAPPWTRFVIASADVQGNRFAVQITAFGIDGRKAIIDRFDLHIPPQDAPFADDRMLDPAKYFEDWGVLLPILRTPYRVDGEDYGLIPMAMGCDFHGAAGVSDNATKFWQKRRSEGEASRWFFIRGHGGFKVDGRFWYKAPSRRNDGRVARDIKLLNIATDKFKDTVFAALGRQDGGQSSLMLGDWIPDEPLKEFTAEVWTSKGYEPVPGQTRNESIDLTSYAQAVAEYKGLLDLAPSNPPRWAIGGLNNEFAVPFTSEGEVVEGAPTRPAKKRTPRRIAYLE